MNLFSNSISTLERAIGQSVTKQKVISNNIANVDTPNYKAQEVRFQNTLNGEIDRLHAFKTNEKHIEFSGTTRGYQIKTSNQTAYQQNGNSVDIDKEMTEMAKNQIQYNALIDRLSSKFNSLKTVIKGGN
ncbi:flagellar basal body rod protein FlgB [Metabacillus malikii]|uniref:Flagellar basal body rod protein FlgB n=1 Tax=Metabacillus malikii TaxID=1504265 RepID=A0ABT9ZH28_9BACI|nr:flagellar basal body rod protein FlgB [Metabacillus malikii]MDQ0230540.1 flagellar basal-body rod protein FlgB [Metabacillus malikii]